MLEVFALEGVPGISHEGEQWPYLRAEWGGRCVYES